MTPVHKLKNYLTTDEIFAQIYGYVRTRFEAAPHLTAHTFEHAYRDVINAIIIGEAENADMTVVLPAMVMHDIGYLYGGTGRTHDELGARKLDDFLADGHIVIPEPKLSHIRACILTHKGSVHNVVPETIEAKVVSDADMLEKIGPIGVYQLIRSLDEFKMDAETTINRLQSVDSRTLSTKTGNEMAAKLHGVATNFAQRLDDAYQIYREDKQGVPL